MQTNEPVSLAKRFAENPILRPEDLRPSRADFRIECLLNPGVFRFDGRIWLLVRVAERPEQTPGRTTLPVMNAQGSVDVLEFDHADPLLDRSDPRVIRYEGRDYLTTLSHLRLLCSTDGVTFSERHELPAALFGEGPLEAYGIEDCRVTCIDGTYRLTYTAVSANGVGVGLRTTRDWRTFEDHGMMLPPHNKDCALFEGRIFGLWYALHRPSSPAIGGNYLWLAESPDGVYWGNHRVVAHPRPGMWDSARIGAGASPIRTEQGWLQIYHGADSAHRYCLGGLLLDAEEPWRVLARSGAPLMEPVAAYETRGFFGSVVFTNGHLVDGDQLSVYYGASDSVICGARFSIARILASLESV